MHIFWIAGLLLAMIDLPDFGTPMRSIAGSVERIADATPGARHAGPEAETAPGGNSSAQAPAKEGRDEMVALLLAFAGGYIDVDTWIIHGVMANAQTANYCEVQRSERPR